MAISRKFRVEDASDRTTKKSKPSSGGRSRGSISVDSVSTDDTEIDDIQFLLSDVEIDHEVHKVQGNENESPNVT